MPTPTAAGRPRRTCSSLNRPPTRATAELDTLARPRANCRAYNPLAPTHDHQDEPDARRPGGWPAPDRHVDQSRAQSRHSDAAQERRPPLRARRHGALVAVDRDGRGHGRPGARARFPARGASAGRQSRVDHPAARRRRVGPARAAGRYARDCRTRSPRPRTTRRWAPAAWRV